MKCTAPCIPPCQNEAVETLLNWKSKSFLGHNCEEHLRGNTKAGGEFVGLLRIRGGDGNFDYDSVAMTEVPNGQA